MTVRIFRSTDPGAPLLNGVSGSLVNVLDAALVNGYTIATWAATTAISLGAVYKPTSSNGRYYQCTTAGTTGGSQPTWPTTTGNTVTDGSVVWTDVGLIPTALGWTKAYSGTNAGAYRMNTTGSTGAYLKVDDNIATNFNRAGLTGYVTMSGISTGTDPFHSSVNFVGVMKSATIDAAARAWVVIGDEFRFFLLVQSCDNIAQEWDPYFFGDIFSYVSGDAYRCLLSGRYNATITSQTFSTNALMSMQTYAWTAQSGVHMPRTHAAVAPSITVGQHTDTFKGANAAASAYVAGSQGPLAYPNIANNGMFMAPIYIHQNTTSPYVVRGYMPGLWAPLHARPVGNNDTFAGVGAMSSKTFEAFFVRNGGQLFIETSDTWS